MTPDQLAPSNEVTITTGGALPAPVAPANEAILSVIARAAADPSVDVTKMQALLDMQLRIMERTAEAQFNAAMSRLQPKLPRIVREGKASYGQGKGGYAYARYEDIDHQIRPLLNAEGFALSFDSVWGEKLCTIIGKLSHAGGHSTAASIPLPLDTSGGKNGIQGMGSTLSYGKRYCVGMLLNIVTVGEDDDAHYLPPDMPMPDTGGHPAGSREAQDYVAQQKLAALGVNVDDVPNTPKPQAKTGPKSTQKTTNFSALEAFGAMKKDFIAAAGKERGEQEYYRILGANGFEKSNQIIERATQVRVYKEMGARLNEIRLDEQYVRDEREAIQQEGKV